MDQKTSIALEIILAIIIIAIVLLPQLIGTTTVVDDAAGLDENGCPVTATTLTDLEAPGTRFGTLTIQEWENEIQKRFPKGELRHYNSMANLYAGLDAGEVDAALGFIDVRQTLAETHPNLAFIEDESGLRWPESESPRSGRRGFPRADPARLSGPELAI